MSLQRVDCFRCGLRDRTQAIQFRGTCSRARCIPGPGTPWLVRAFRLPAHPKGVKFISEGARDAGQDFLEGTAPCENIMPSRNVNDLPFVQKNKVSKFLPSSL